MPHLYNNIPGWFDSGFADVYDKIVSELPQFQKGLVVEVGCWKGKSSCYLLELIKESGKAIYPIFVDTFKGDEYGINGIDGSDEPNFRKNLLQNGFVGWEKYRIEEYHYTTIITDSIELAKSWPNNYCDFVMLDGCHQSDYVRREILAWKDKTKILAGHDFLDPPIRSIVQELLPNVEDYGSCYLWRKP